MTVHNSLALAADVPRHLSSFQCAGCFDKYLSHLDYTVTVCQSVCAAQGVSDPEKVFDRTANLENTQIINYRVDPAEKWCVLIGIAPGAAERCVPRAHCGRRVRSWASWLGRAGHTAAPVLCSQSGTKGPVSS